MSKIQIELRELERFASVIEAQSMTVAAQRLGMTQSAVSQTINSLEQKLGVTLIDRAVRPICLTVPGRLLYERTKQLLEQARAATHEVRFAAHQSLPRLRFGLVDSFAATVGPQLMLAHVDLASSWSIWSGLSMMHEEALQSRAVDIIVTASEMGTNDEFERRQLLSEPFMIAMPRKRNWQSESIQQLAGAHPFIRFSQRSLIGQQIEQYFRRRRIDVPHRYEFDSSESVVSMVAAGIGWALITPLCMLQAINSIEQIQLLRLSPGMSRRLTMIYRPHELGEAPEKLFASAVQILGESCLPRVLHHAPWASELITLGEDGEG